MTAKKLNLDIDYDQAVLLIAEAVDSVMGQHGLCFYDRRGKEVYGGRPWSNEADLKREIATKALENMFREMQLNASTEEEF